MTIKDAVEKTIKWTKKAYINNENIDYIMSKRIRKYQNIERYSEGEYKFLFKHKKDD